MDGEVAETATRSGVECARELTLRAIEGLPAVQPGDDLGALLTGALERQGTVLQQHDVIVVTSKVVSKAENRYVDLAAVEPSEQACQIAQVTGSDPRLVEVVLWDSEKISRQAKGALIVRHHGGHVSANAGLDQSNARPSAPVGTGPWVLRLPADPDASAARLRAQLEQHCGVALAVVVSDSFGRPFRFGTVGVAVGVSGMPALCDQRGRLDLYGRALEHTITAAADQLCAAADLICGQADEGRAAVLVRGLRFEPSAMPARSLCRPIDGDLYL